MLESEANYSFIENKNINNTSFNSRMSIGFGINAIFDIKLHPKFNILSGIRLTSSNYRYYLNKVKFKTNNFGLSMPIYFEYNIKNIHRKRV